MRVQQLGVLITGEPGSGKSDTALSLLRTGQQLVADDAVLIDGQDKHHMTGYAPTAGLGLLHIRGIGLIDARKHFGEKAVLASSMIHFRVHIDQHQQVDTGFENWPIEAYYGIHVPTLNLAPLRPLAALITLAAVLFAKGQKRCD